MNVSKINCTNFKNNNSRNILNSENAYRTGEVLGHIGLVSAVTALLTTKAPVLQKTALGVSVTSNLIAGGINTHKLIKDIDTFNNKEDKSKIYETSSKLMGNISFATVATAFATISMKSGKTTFGEGCLMGVAVGTSILEGILRHKATSSNNTTSS